MLELPKYRHYKMSPELKQKCKEVYNRYNTDTNYPRNELQNCFDEMLEARNAEIKKAQEALLPILRHPFSELIIGKNISVCTFERDEDELLLDIARLLSIHRS